MKTKKLCAFALAGILSSSLAIADVNLSAQHQLVSVSNVSGGSEAIFNITITNTGSDNLNTLVFTSADSNISIDLSNALSAGTQTTLQVTINAPVDSKYFNNDSLLLFNVNGFNDLGELVNLPIAVERGVQ